MITITIYGYVFNGKKWKYKQKSIPIELDYDNAKHYAKEIPVSRIAELDNTESDMLIVFTKDETNRIRQFLKSLGD